MMLDVSRRSFLGGALALTVVAALPVKAFATVPTIYGDGVHDDWAGLQAMFDGEPFLVDGEGFEPQRVHGSALLRGGAFKISRTLHLGRNGNVHCVLDHCSLVSSADPTLYMHDNSLASSPATSAHWPMIR
jgi:hypothetical protein